MKVTHEAIVERRMVMSFELIFEPGNASRYHLMLSGSRAKDGVFMVTDMNTEKVYRMPHPRDAKSKVSAQRQAEQMFLEYGLGPSDAKGMSQYVHLMY